MPPATPRQYAAMLDAATDGGYAYAAINVTCSETLNAALRGFKLANANGIVQISVGRAEHTAGTPVKDALLGARAFARYAHVVAEASPVLVALHTDQCPPPHVDDWLHLLAGGIPAARRTRRHPVVSLPHVRRLDASARREPADCGPPCSPDVASSTSSSRSIPVLSAVRRTGSWAPRTGATSCTPRLPTPPRHRRAGDRRARALPDHGNGRQHGWNLLQRQRDPAARDPASRQLRMPKSVAGEHPREHTLIVGIDVNPHDSERDRVRKLTLAESAAAMKHILEA